MAKKNDKKILLIIPGVLLVVIIAYFKLANNGDGADKKKVEYEVPNVSPKDNNTDNMSREELYDKAKKDKENEKLDSLKKNQDYDDIFKSVNKKDTQPKTVIEEKPVVKTAAVKKTATVKTQTRTEPVTTTNNTTTTEPKKTYYGFGVVSGSTTTKATTTKSTTSEDWIPADFEKDYVIKNKSQFVLNLKKETTINGIKFGKMSTMYGYAKLTGSGGRMNVFEIYVNQITNSADGENYPVTLVGYNEYYQRGILYEGKVEQAVNDASSESVQNSSTGVNTSTGVVNNAANTVTRGLSKVVKKDPEININEGYRMYFKPDKTQ